MFYPGYRSIFTSKLIVKFLPGFAWCKYHPDAHSLPSQNLSPYTSLLHQQEHFLQPSPDELSEKYVF